MYATFNWLIPIIYAWWQTTPVGASWHGHEVPDCRSSRHRRTSIGDLSTRSWCLSNFDCQAQRRRRPLQSTSIFADVTAIYYRIHMPDSSATSRPKIVGGRSPFFFHSLLFPSTLPFLPLLSFLSFPLEVDPLKFMNLGSAVSFPAGFGAKPKSKSNLVHFSFKIWHLVATILMIFPRLLLPATE